MQFRTVCSGLAFNIMSSMKSTSRLSRSILPMESENLSWSSSTSYSRAHISLEIFSITNLTLPPYKLSVRRWDPRLTWWLSWQFYQSLTCPLPWGSVLASSQFWLPSMIYILRRNTNIVARSHLNQSFDFFRDVEVKPRRIFSSKGSLGDILTVTIYWNQFPEAHFFARHQIAIKGYHLTLDMTINIKKLLALRNQVWHCEPGLALLSTPLRSRFIWVEVQYKLQTIIYNISHISHISYLLLIV